MKKPINRVPTDILDELSIYCFMLRQEGMSYNEIVNIIGKDRTTVLYHIRRYKDLLKFNKIFRLKIKNFSEKKFLHEYKKTGCLNAFYNGIFSVPDFKDNKENVDILVTLVSKLNQNQMQKIINYCQVIAS